MRSDRHGRDLKGPDVTGAVRASLRQPTRVFQHGPDVRVSRAGARVAPRQALHGPGPWRCKANADHTHEDKGSFVHSTGKRACRSSRPTASLRSEATKAWQRSRSRRTAPSASTACPWPKAPSTPASPSTNPPPPAPSKSPSASAGHRNARIPICQTAYTALIRIQPGLEMGSQGGYKRGGSFPGSVG